jgi:hypothetical protein
MKYTRSVVAKGRLLQTRGADQRITNRTETVFRVKKSACTGSTEGNAWHDLVLVST